VKEQAEQSEEEATENQNGKTFNMEEVNDRIHIQKDIKE
jgi:hypothetical protein